MNHCAQESPYPAPMHALQALDDPHVLPHGTTQFYGEYLPLSSHINNVADSIWSMAERGFAAHPSNYEAPRPSHIAATLHPQEHRAFPDQVSISSLEELLLPPQEATHLSCDPSTPLSYPTWEPVFTPQDASAPAHTFPTPSEMLMELAAKGNEDPYSETKRETPRPSKRRIVMRTPGVTQPPEPISSHEKKRHYLECLEHYVVYLQQQMGLLQAESIPMERIANYRGLSSRSIRTLLVHMQATAEKLNMRTLTEEQRFLRLREAVREQEGNTLKSFLEQHPELQSQGL
ncbi:hypothetical protein AX16_009651 [Volvariella volvacea WC 439]|nr:hypothetical protein AX16_009651 [Volvariella volvacea WC 439]